MSKLKHNLKILWNEATGPESKSRRFLCRAYSNRGTGWGVWDQKYKRFLDNADVALLTEEQLREPWVQ
jgi:hypothetical protein